LKIPITKIDLDEQTIAAAVNTLKSGQWILGKKTQKFESEFAKFCRVKHAICVSSGTTALFLSLKSLGVKKGDEVIVPSFSFIATASAVSMCGGIPKFVDINEKNFTINPFELENKINKKTVGIIPVHLFGHAADMDQINKIAKQNSLFVLEDAAQAHGCKYKNKMIGSLGDVSCFSFYPSKNLTVCGDGGMITTNNSEIANEIKMLRNHGRKAKYEHSMIGYNFRMGEVNAAMGLIRLKKLIKNNSSRKKIANKYDNELMNVITPIEEKWTSHVYHQYSIQTKNREKLIEELKKHNIDSAVFYPLPIHKQPIYKKFNKIKLPVTEKLSKNILSLPMYPSMTKIEQDYVIKTINKFNLKYSG